MQQKVLQDPFLRFEFGEVGVELSESLDIQGNTLFMRLCVSFGLDIGRFSDFFSLPYVYSTSSGTKIPFSIRP